MRKHKILVCDWLEAQRKAQEQAQDKAAIAYAVKRMIRHVDTENISSTEAESLIEGFCCDYAKGKEATTSSAYIKEPTNV